MILALFTSMSKMPFGNVLGRELSMDSESFRSGIRTEVSVTDLMPFRPLSASTTDAPLCRGLGDVCAQPRCDAYDSDPIPIYARHIAVVPILFFCHGCRATCDLVIIPVDVIIDIHGLQTEGNLNIFKRKIVPSRNACPLDAGYSPFVGSWLRTRKDQCVCRLNSVDRSALRVGPYSEIRFNSRGPSIIWQISTQW
ncbi:MAG: hypothetical protein PWR17_268 [Candidatus Methanomethylophilaceae archaeon]|nr:hypothetical protein [Candidatus Methanomethylophilaceae archaeon]